MSVSGLRPWFSEEIGQLLKSLIFTLGQGDTTEEYRKGYYACCYDLCLAMDINPQLLEKN